MSEYDVWRLTVNAVLLQIQGGEGGPGDQPLLPPAGQPRQEQEEQVPQGCSGVPPKGLKVYFSTY